jgi:phage-related protein
MAGSVAMSYRLFGEDVSASKAMKGVGDAADKAGEQIEDAAGKGDSLGRVGDHADVSEQRIMGLKDSVDGLSTVLQGPGEQGVAAYLQGWADMASGVANFVIPSLGMLRPSVIKNAAATAWSTTTQYAAAAASKVMAAGQWLLNAALSANPIGLVVLAIAALIAIVVLAYQKNETFRRIVDAVWTGIKTAISAVVNWFMNTAWPILQRVIGFIIGYYKLLWTVFSTVVGWIIEKGKALVSWFTGLPERIGSAVSGLWDGIKDSFRNALNWIIRAWNDFQIQFPSFDFDWNGPLPGGEVTVGGWTVNTPNIPQLAAGGIVRRRPGGILANIGEGRYDEAIVPLDGRGLGDTYNIYVTQPLGSPAQIARAVAAATTRAGRNGAVA